MTNCEKCGFSLPEGAEYCPNCGAQVRKEPQATVPSLASIGKLLQAGLLGAFLSVTVLFFMPADFQLYFLPSFIGALVATYLFRVRRLEEALVIAFATYLFAQGIMSGINLGYLYMNGISLSEAYMTYTLTIVDVVLYSCEPVTAVVAAYIGNRLAPKPTTRRTSPYTYQEKKERGGIVFSTNAEEESSTFPSHKV